MIPQATADALARIAARAQDVRHSFDPGFEPQDPALVRREVVTTASLDPLSVSAPEGTYFLTGAPENRARLSRDGGFSFEDGTLRSRDGAPVRGFLSGGQEAVPLRADPIDVALGRVADPRIERDGSLVYDRTFVDPRGGNRRVERVVVGRVALARLPAGTLPVRQDDSHVDAPPGVAPVLGRPGDAGIGPLQTFARDLGRVDPLAGLERLREAYVSFEAIRAAGAARGGLEQTAMDLLK
jgi:hypothetical protein